MRLSIQIHAVFYGAERGAKGLRAFAQSRLSAGLWTAKSRISAAMEYRQDNDAMILCAKINAIWKTIGDNAPNVLANNGKPERIFRCQRYATVKLGHELKSKAKTFGSYHPLASMNSALAAR